MQLQIPSFETRDWDQHPVGGPLRIAVIGLGGFARDTALPAIEASRYCTSTALVSGSKEKAISMADAFDVDQALTYNEYEDGVGNEAYDAVYVVTPNALHLPHVRTAANYGKDVLCEKPLEADVDRARRLVEVCESAGVLLMTAYRMQVTPSVRWVRSLIRRGMIGDPVQVHSEFSIPYLDLVDGAGWRTDPDLSGGGALMDVGIYPMNTTRFVLDSDPISVCGSTSSDHPVFDDVDEHVAFELGFPNGLTASCTASFNASQSERLTVQGTAGRIDIDPVFEVDQDRTVTVETSDGRITVDVTEPNEVVEEFDYFAMHSLTDEVVPPDGRHGLTDVRIGKGVYRSDREGVRVDL